MRKHDSHHSHRSSSSRHGHHSKKDHQRLIYDSKHEEHHRRSRSRSRSSSSSRNRSPSFSLLRSLCEGATLETLEKTHSREVSEIRAGLHSDRKPDPYQISHTPVLVSSCDLASSIDSSQKVRFDLHFDLKPLQAAKEERRAAELREYEARIRLEAIQDQLKKYASS